VTGAEAHEQERESALEEVLEERNRLWEELNRRAAQEHELDHLRATVRAMEGSLSWRVTRPLRAGKRFVEADLPRLRERLRERRARRRR
jgi:hypothetical protein